MTLNTIYSFLFWKKKKKRELTELWAEAVLYFYPATRVTVWIARLGVSDGAKICARKATTVLSVAGGQAKCSTWH